MLQQFWCSHAVVKDFGPCLVGRKEYIKVLRQRYQVHNSCLKNINFTMVIVDSNGV